MDALKDFFSGKDIRHVLDVGTGNGKFIGFLQELFPQAKFTGVDPDQASINEARDNFPGITFRLMAAEKLEFEPETFDVVTLSMALHHLTGIKRGLKEMKRVLTPGGWIIISELFNDQLTPAQEVQQMYHHFRSRIDRLTGVSHRESFEKEQILQMVREAGISIQFYFELHARSDIRDLQEEVSQRVKKMEIHLEKIRNFPEYNSMYEQIPVFREKALLCGIEPAPRIVLVGKKHAG